MSFVSIVPTRTVNRAGEAERSDRLGYRLTMFLWVLYLFAPQKMIQFHFKDARPLTWATEALLWATMALWSADRIRGREREKQSRGYPAFTIFILLTILGMVMASIYGDWDRARMVMRQLYQFYFLAILTLHYCSTPERSQTVLRSYLLSFLYYGLWGAYSLYRSPLGSVADPGFREIVYWHVSYVNRDAFGPLMAVGLMVALYYLQASIPKSRAAVATVVLALVGVVTSFARGVFLSLIAGGIAAWLKSRHRARVALLALCCLAIVPIVAPQMAERYISAMGTIVSEGADKGTGADRKILWTWALRVFKLNPIAGVGPQNFGIAVFDVVSPREAADHGYTPGRLYGRVLHSTPMTILCEYGLLGVGAFLFLLVDFFRTNAAMRRLTVARGFAPNFVPLIATGLQTAGITLCINSVFYEILYIPIFWNLLVVNRLLYFASGAAVTRGVPPIDAGARA